MVSFPALLVATGIWWWPGWFLRGTSLRWENGAELVDDAGPTAPSPVATSTEVETVAAGLVAPPRLGSRLLRTGLLLTVPATGERRPSLATGLRGPTPYCHSHEQTTRFLGKFSKNLLQGVDDFSIQGDWSRPRPPADGANHGSPEAPSPRLAHLRVYCNDWDRDSAKAAQILM